MISIPRRPSGSGLCTKTGPAGSQGTGCCGFHKNGMRWLMNWWCLDHLEILRSKIKNLNMILKTCWEQSLAYPLSKCRISWPARAQVAMKTMWPRGPRGLLEAKMAMKPRYKLKYCIWWPSRGVILIALVPSTNFCLDWNHFIPSDIALRDQMSHEKNTLVDWLLSGNTLTGLLGIII